MPEPNIRISRSAGNTWPTRFGPAPPGTASLPDNHEVAASVSQVAQNVGSLGNNIAPGPLNNLSDVDILNVQDGDLLRFANKKWRNYNETNVTDGGNF